jgi:sulfonate transport system permease protein
MSRALQTAPRASRNLQGIAAIGDHARERAGIGTAPATVSDATGSEAIGFDAVEFDAAANADQGFRMSSQPGSALARPTLAPAQFDRQPQRHEALPSRGSTGSNLVITLRDSALTALKWTFPFVLLLATWHWVTAREIFPVQLLVPPMDVARAALELLQTRELQMHLSISFHRLALGIGFGAVAGLLFGILMAVSRTVEVYTTPIFNVVRQVPAVALIPVLILLFGIGETFKVLIIIKAAFFPVALAAYQSVKGISSHYIDVARLYQLPRRILFLRVLLPATTPEIITGFRLAVGRSWGTLVAAELLAAESGLGQMMEFGRQMFRMDVVMVGLVITGLVGFGLDRLIKQIEARFMRWRSVTT